MSCPDLRVQRGATELASLRRGPQGAFSVELITPPYRGCRLPPPRKRGRGRRGGEALRRWLRRSASWMKAPKTEQVRILSSAPARPTIAPAGSGAPASLQPRALAGLRLPAAPGRRSCQHCCPTCNSCNPEASGGWGGGARAGVCECMCLIASLLFFPSLPDRLPACLRPPPSLSYTQGELASEAHSRTHAHTRRLHEWEAGANPTRPAEPRLEQGCTTAPGGATQVMLPLLPWPLGLLSAHSSLLCAMPSLISVLPFSELLSPSPHLIFFLEFS